MSRFEKKDTSSAEYINEWVKIVDPQTQNIIFANPRTGDCSWDKPKGAVIKENAPGGEWWELFDSKHNLPYYYNTESRQTVWIRPKKGLIIPLSKIQTASSGVKALNSEPKKQTKAPSVKSDRKSRKSNSLKPSGNSSMIELNTHPNNDNSADITIGSITSVSEPVLETEPETANCSVIEDIDQVIEEYVDPVDEDNSSETAVNNITSNIVHPPVSTLNEVEAESKKEDSEKQLVDTQESSPPTLMVNSEDIRPESMFTPTSNNELAEAKAETPTQNRASSYVPAAKSSAAVDVAKKNGIGSPTLDNEAAKHMSPLTPGKALNPTNAGYNVDSPKALPADLQSDINQFQINGFAKKFFSTHKKGLLRRKIPLEKLLVWSAESLYQPLLVLNKNLHKDALKCFKNIQKVMGDRSPVKGNTSFVEIQWVLERGIINGEIRDEIYVQICKQLTENPNPPSIKLGWQLLGVIVISFPPSKNFESYFKNFIRQNLRNPCIPEIKEIGNYCQNKLARICKNGPRGKVPTLAEIEQAMDAPFYPSVFGESLNVIMQRQLKEFPDLKLPRVLPFLSDSILSLRGDQSEGIFRVPGDMEQVSELRMRIDKNHYTLEDITDCNVPGSLLKFWLRDLEDPLIPPEFYSKCVQNAKTSDAAIAILSELPEFNQRVSKFMIQFLQIFAREESASRTKMSVQNLAMVFAPSFLRCPSDDLTEIFTNSKYEQEFLSHLITNFSGPPQER